MAPPSEAFPLVPLALRDLGWDVLRFVGRLTMGRASTVGSGEGTVTGSMVGRGSEAGIS